MRADDMQKEADIVVVFGGTNDYGHGDAPLGAFSDRTPYTFYGACHELFQKLIINYPDSVIVIVTPLHRENELNPRGEGAKPNDVGTLSVYVDIIKEVARYYSLAVCDLYANSGLQPNVAVIKEQYIPDGLHPNDKGNQVIAERLGEFLRSL
jgi:lysophospholipase L1-like esterase